MIEYPLLFEDKYVGDITVQMRGLYYHFVCICNKQIDLDYRICVYCGNKKTDLGICVPENGYFILRKQLAIKHIGNGVMRFCLEKKCNASGTMVPILESKPFERLEDIEDAKLVIEDGMYFAQFRQE